MCAVPEMIGGTPPDGPIMGDGGHAGVGLPPRAASCSQLEGLARRGRCSCFVRVSVAPLKVPLKGSALCST